MVWHGDAATNGSLGRRLFWQRLGDGGSLFRCLVAATPGERERCDGDGQQQNGDQHHAPLALNRSRTRTLFSSARVAHRLLVRVVTLLVAEVIHFVDSAS